MSDVDGSTSPPSVINERMAWVAVVVAALGYFVDVFDIWLFSNYRITSLRDLGLEGSDLTSVGVMLLNFQLAGFLLGGFFWGILGDKRGRAKVMFGSIFLYSAATLLNSFVNSIEQYAILRFLSGVGLAGEIGAGITLVAELLPKNKRGWGTMIVISFGVTGAVGAAVCAKLVDWRTAYIIGGVMGFALLGLRLFVHESSLFDRLGTAAKRAPMRALFGNWRRALRYLSCIAAGIPIYVTFGLFASFAPEIARSLGIEETVNVPDIMLWTSVGMTIGDVLAGTLSQILKSRKVPIFIFLVVGTLFTIALGFGGVVDSVLKYSVLVGLMAVCGGYWACLITATAEQFGTNIRATATTTVPNLVRGSTIILTTGFLLFQDVGMNAATSAVTIACLSVAIASACLHYLDETFYRDLDFIEE